MESRVYNSLVRFAKQHIPSQSALDARDLVSEAFVQVGASNIPALKKGIIDAGYLERHYCSAHLPFFDKEVQMPSLKSYPVETTRICKTCGLEKSHDAFNTQSKASNPELRYTYHECKTCQYARLKRKSGFMERRRSYAAGYRERKRLRVKTEPQLQKKQVNRSKINWQKELSDPQKHAKRLAVRREAYQRAKAEGRLPPYTKRPIDLEKSRVNSQRRRDMVKADPELYQQHLAQQRVRDARRRANRSRQRQGLSTVPVG